MRIQVRKPRRELDFFCVLSTAEDLVGKINLLTSPPRVRKQPIIALYFESENELKFYNLEAISIDGNVFQKQEVTHSTMLRDVHW